MVREQSARLGINDAVEAILAQESRTREREEAHLQALAPPATQAGTRYAGLYAPPPDDLVALRREQAEFRGIREGLDQQNALMAVAALGPAAAVLALEAMGLLGGAAGASALIAKRPLNLPDREVWQRGARHVGKELTRDAKNPIWKEGRRRFARANDLSAADMDAYVHHSDPLQWAHLKPNADPNRLANLWPLMEDAHAIASREWAAFSRLLKGRTPTPAEQMAAKLRIEGMVAQYIRRRGATVRKVSKDELTEAPIKAPKDRKLP